MTKLMEWLLAASLIFGIWIALITGRKEPFEDIEWYYKWFPVILIFLFGIYAAVVVIYRVLTFNNCEEAVIELKAQIQEAITDLESKGIRLKTKSQ